MQGLAAGQIEQIKHKRLGITGPLADTLGNIPLIFILLIYGDNGQGKTELAFQLIKELQRHGRVDWMSYEQGHGSDIQDSIIRHKVRQDKWDCVFYDPYKSRDYSLTLFQELCKHLDKPRSAKFIVMDSVDECRFTNEEIQQLNERYARKKSFIWLSYEGGNKKPKTSEARNIGGFGSYIVRVHKFIAYVQKSRYKGGKDYIIYEQKARELNPLYFAEKETPTNKGAKPKTSKKGKIIAI